MKKRIFDILKFAVFLSIGLGLVVLSVKDLTANERSEILVSFRNANYFWIILVILLGILSHISRSIRWVMLIETMGYKPSVKNTFYAVMVGYLANMAFPRIGEVTRCGILDRYEKIPFNKSLGTVITERAFDMIIFILIFIVTFFIEFNHVNNYLQEFIFPKLGLKFLSLGKLLMYASCLFLIFIGVVVFIFKRYKENKNIQKINHLIYGFWHGLRSITLVKHPFLFIFHTIFIWSMYYLMLYLCFFCFPETSSISMGAGLSCLAIGSIAIMVTPGGIGLYPFTFRGVLGLYAVSPTMGFALGWIAWTSQTIMITSLGVLSLILLHYTKKNPSINDTPSNNQ